jgi:hypothetical protein
MAQKQTPAEIVADIIAQKQDKAPLILQAMYLLDEPCYEQALRYVLAMAPDDCEQFIAKMNSATAPQPYDQ